MGTPRSVIRVTPARAVASRRDSRDSARRALERRLDRGLERGLEATRFLDEIERPALRLPVDAADVLADDAEREQLRATDEEDGDEQRGPTGDPVVREEAQHQRV